MKIHLIDKKKDMVAEWQKVFFDCPDVEIQEGDILSKEVDCIVSPSNSFGFMDGGLEYSIVKLMGRKVEDAIKEIIQIIHHGELLVGHAIIVPTQYKQIPLLISAPTMRVPMILSDSVNIYLAMRAVFILLKKNFGVISSIKSVSFCGMGTGVGQVPYEICARQMRKAYDDFWVQDYTYPKSWTDAQIKHQLLYSTETRDLQMK